MDNNNDEILHKYEEIRRILEEKKNNILLYVIDKAINYINIENPQNYTSNICCCYRVFSKAIYDYKDVPSLVEELRYYAGEMIYIIDKITGEKIRETSDTFNEREKSIPTNLLYWYDIIENKKEEIYSEIREFIKTVCMSKFYDVQNLNFAALSA